MRRLLALALLFAAPLGGAAQHAVRVGGVPHRAEAASLRRSLLERPIRLVLDDAHVLEGSVESLGGRAVDASVQAIADGSPEADMDAPLTLDIDRAFRWLVEQKARIDRPAASARLDPETGRVVPEQEGVSLDVWASLEALRAALRQGGDAQVVVRRTGAGRSADELEGASFEGLLGVFETPYNGSGDAAERTHNLRVAASKVDGVVLFPGEVFDFNEVVGERSLAAGFRPAPVIAGGELVDGVGGGACQIAGTLHAAAFFAGLAIVERHPHSRPSSYIKLGLDAAVSYPNLNFRLRNDRATPVMIRMIIAGGRARAEVRGDALQHRVEFVRRIEEFLPFEERVVEDDSLPTGVRVLKQRGVPGFVVARYRWIENAATRLRRRESSEDRYPPTTQVWRVGTGGAAPADFEVPVGDTHREYTADAFTRMTQGLGVEGTTTVRRA
ncbi:MAG: VanW family protein, partial [Myxococcota bacterium]